MDPTGLHPQSVYALPGRWRREWGARRDKLYTREPLHSRSDEIRNAWGLLYAEQWGGFSEETRFMLRMNVHKEAVPERQRQAYAVPAAAEGTGPCTVKFQPAGQVAGDGGIRVGGGGVEELGWGMG